MNLDLQLAPLEDLDLSQLCGVRIDFTEEDGDKPVPSVFDRRTGQTLMRFGARSFAEGWQRASDSIAPQDRRRTVRK